MYEVGKFAVEFDAGGDGDHPPCVVIGMHAHFGDDVAGLGFALVLVFHLHHGFLTLIGMNLADDNLPRTRYLVHCQGGAQGVVGVGVVPVTQGAVTVGFTQFCAGINSIFGPGTGHRGPEKQCAGIGMEVLILEAVYQFGGFYCVRRAANGDAEVPGCEIDHVNLPFYSYCTSVPEPLARAFWGGLYKRRGVFC
ncbi:hypothetical protein D3C80_1335980 [compost metagenome]